MGEQKEAQLSNPPIKNVLVVSGILWGAIVVGYLGGQATRSVTTWLWVGIGIGVLYLLYDIANSVKELRYSS
ncbi:Mn2+/Fe2+ transporter [Natronorubrum daqingense]|uniref:Mn2+/Fe2+ transporter n=1 Tax=Natronorubrum daqingense TaxID=588898 RepID=A0A1N7CNQ3_9EURY|nr:Mn2+/Fe2+ transporter [Natronorubrum daqingense]APX98213.1 Mn2+/Fe2+ transporter [Natronorubrum daqingense]SIR65145.1 hypothetical protein SAMN05421809_1795 [Natronorubrum daqingense]